MGNTSKSPLAIAREALDVGVRSLPKYGHKHSPKKYTQAQLFALLVLRNFFRTDYRGIVSIVRDSKELQTTLGITDIPHHTTLSTASRRLEQKGGCTTSLLEAWSKGRRVELSADAVVVPSMPRG